jgi:hypothetical protein
MTVRPSHEDRPSADPTQPQVAVVERTPKPETVFKWPPGLVVNLEWAAVWSVD